MRLRVCLSWLLGLVACQGPLPMPPYAAPAAPSVRPDGPLIILGDTQRTSWPERLLLCREQNEDPRRALIAMLAEEERPAFVIHLGDMVAVGDSADHWEYFDRLMSPLTVRGVPIVPVMGNHDYWGDDGDARREAARRFPQLGPSTWYAMVKGRLGLVWLDTNLGDDERQTRFFAEIMTRFEADPAIRAILVFGHHPAYTLGVARSGDDDVRALLDAHFMPATKAAAYFSGHVHGYERYLVAGKTFVVSGGAGGPRVSYRDPEPDEPPPAYRREGHGPLPFHYLRLRESDAHLEVEARCLPDGDDCRDGRLERFVIPWPDQAAVRVSSSRR
ncbi:MAG: metallophosphoesterase [Polyangiaceae bacterium]